MSRKLDYQDALFYLYSIERFGIQPGLSRIISVLSSLGNPHNFFPSILIAGTNGKGSTVEMVSSIVKNAGYKVGIYTSPHLHKFEERIRINNSRIQEETVVRLTQTIKSLLFDREEYLTFFECVTVMAFLYFKEEDIDIAVLEVGMGGRLDAVNVVDPVVSVITDIGYDHSEWLGNTIQEIACEKAGIIKDNTVVVTSCRNTEAAKTIKRAGMEKSADVLCIFKDFDIEIKESKQLCTIFDFFDKKMKITDILLPCAGEHFAFNASAAIEAVWQLKERGYDITESDIRHGLEKIKLPCRNEQVAAEPTVLIDVAHNPLGVSALIQSITGNFQFNRLYIVFGVMKEKMIPEMLAILSPYAHRIILTGPSSPRAADPETILQENPSLADKGIVIHNVAEAIKEAIVQASPDDLICITGSFVTAAEARGFF